MIETGKTYTFKATTSLPYKGMDVQVKGSSSRRMGSGLKVTRRNTRPMPRI